MAQRPRKNLGRRLAPRHLTAGIVLMATLAAACGEPRPAAESPEQPLAAVPSQRDQLLLASAKVALPPAGLTLSDLPNSSTPGAAAVQKYCTMCHELPTPRAHSATDWPRVLRRMWLRMGLVDSGLIVPTPTDTERFAMLQYVIDNALQVSDATLPDLPGRPKYKSTCSRCHELPDPAQHSPADWATTIRRMSGHMEDLLRQPLSREDYVTITEYLRAVSRGQV